MPKTTHTFLLKYGVPILAIVVIIVHLFFVNTQNLTKWKGGGYGMYTGIHFHYHQIYIPTLSVDSLAEHNTQIKEAFRELKLMPNQTQLRKTAELILKSTQKDSIHIQIWKPIADSKYKVYSRTLIEEIHLKTSDL
ncbi:MAG: hypothetical protein AB8B52_05210 [Winogradskyella sp.]|uniref:hypothetical protein n=1 Tax=Winogradskyella sp. TaxID=1883156 RepID=UPI00385AC57B